MDNRYSNVWTYFTIVDENVAKCDLCKRKYSYKSTLTNLKKHLSSRHLINCGQSQQINVNKVSHF